MSAIVKAEAGYHGQDLLLEISNHLHLETLSSLPFETTMTKCSYVVLQKEIVIFCADLMIKEVCCLHIKSVIHLAEGCQQHHQHKLEIEDQALILPWGFSDIT